MRISDTTTPVVILKMEHYGSLGIVRSLGTLGIPVFGIDGNPSAPGFSSRYCAGRFLWDIDEADPGRTVEYLFHVREVIGSNPILLPTSDESAVLIADHEEVLSQSFIIPRRGSALVRSLCNKRTMHFLACESGIPTPRTEFPRNRENVRGYCESAMFPVMLKGIDGGRLEQRTGKKMVLAGNDKELLRYYDAMEDPDCPNLMLQEYIPGGEDSVWMFNGYFNEQSECMAGFTGRKLRQNPVYTGMTSLGVCLNNRAVADATGKFMKAIGYRGILDIGYRYDSRDGNYKVLDVNPRIGATFRLFVGKKGLDVARACYLDMTGQPVPGDLAPEGRKWFVEDKDLVSSYRYYRDGKLSVMEWIASYQGVQEAGYFEPRDLKPLYRAIVIDIRHRLKVLLAKFRRRTPLWKGRGKSSVQFGEQSQGQFIETGGRNSDLAIWKAAPSGQKGRKEGRHVVDVRGLQ